MRDTKSCRDTIELGLVIMVCDGSEVCDGV